MRTILKDGKYNTKLEPSDWRYSASIVGLIKYFDYHKSMGEDINYSIDDDILKYNSEDITEERYLLFVEYYFMEDMHHKIVEQILDNDVISDEQVKIINEKLHSTTKSNTIEKNI